ncbi:uncharacterized protein MONBRDRAFT_18868 [Monosiga brevicollis MX1]|uniref:Nudix hydrolase domain-containing protein n=1 Tax=Monosiga brevicollis TaxID=81824 RepID=A9UY32_MONBE|nr:uncharacterized protein MONBRDRAFT_18868 [Monosiga brevicollis MX1]EDQ89949.1 predicted protein [Monosiga brevicollis MX1]|eukprot:XP_001745371.1 hypothetical protein [Monosiga brevicollis MX1]
MAKVLLTSMPALPSSPNDSRSVAPARQGRDNQRYGADGTRLVSGCVPFRCTPAGLDVLLITNRKKTHWIIPKGGWETDESAEEAAIRETYEEAGAQGTIVTKLVDRLHVGKKGQHQHHHYYALLVDQILQHFPEQEQRQRRWFPINDALETCQRDVMHEAILKLKREHTAGRL